MSTEETTYCECVTRESNSILYKKVLRLKSYVFVSAENKTFLWSIEWMQTACSVHSIDEIIIFRDYYILRSSNKKIIF